MVDHFAAPEQGRRFSNAILIGTIAEVDLAAARAAVEIETGLVTALLPWMEMAAGRARSWSPPIVGEQVTVLSPDGETAQGVILRGLPSDALPRPSASADLFRMEWDDGAVDDYDAAAHARTLTIPEGGAFRVILGPALIEVVDGKITLTVGAAGIEIDEARITLSAEAVALLADAVDLGAEGGEPVARVDDAVAGGKVTTGSGSVRAA